MANKAVTLNEVITAVREITFDRFVIPAFALKEMGEGYFLSIDKDYGSSDIKGRLLISHKSDDEAQTEIISLPFSEYPTMESLVTKLIEEGIVVAYTLYFMGEESSDSLLSVTDKELTENVTLFRKYFFSDNEITRWISWYYFKVLDLPDVELTDSIIEQLIRPSERHMALWVSYQVVGRRRLFELASSSLSNCFTDGSDYAGSSDLNAGTSVSVTIGSVFNITEDPNSGFFYEDYNRIGSDNILGDRFSFWYRLQLWIREQLEEIFGDYSLRKDMVMMGHIELERELDFRSYYDSYPFTLSPLSRGILSKTTS